jgi:hypothetical protein
VLASYKNDLYAGVYEVDEDGSLLKNWTESLVHTLGGYSWLLIKGLKAQSLLAKENAVC